MRLRVALAPVLLGAALALLMIADAPAHTERAGGVGRANASARSALTVVEVEYRLILSRGVLKAGPVSLEALDRGMVPHDLRVRKLGQGVGVSAPQLTPGEHWNDVVDLRPGLYYLWCSLPEHARLGMHATLRVIA
jgi:hypothetical protein